MPRPLTVGASSRLEATVSIQSVVEVLCGPWCVHPLNLDVVAIQKLPRGTGSAARGVADLVEEDDGVGVIDKRDVIAQIISGKILGSENNQLVHFSYKARSTLTLVECGCYCTRTNPLPGSKPAAQQHPTSAGRVPSVLGHDQTPALVPGWSRYRAPPPGSRPQG